MPGCGGAFKTCFRRIAIQVGVIGNVKTHKTWSYISSGQIPVLSRAVLVAFEPDAIMWQCALANGLLTLPRQGQPVQLSPQASCSSHLLPLRFTSWYLPSCLGELSLSLLQPGNLSRKLEPWAGPWPQWIKLYRWSVKKWYFWLHNGDHCHSHQEHSDYSPGM